MGGHGHDVRHLLRALHREVSLATLDNAGSPSLVKRELGVEHLGVVLHEPAHSPFATGFFIRGSEEHDIPGESSTGL